MLFLSKEKNEKLAAYNEMKKLQISRFNFYVRLYYKFISLMLPLYVFFAIYVPFFYFIFPGQETPYTILQYANILYFVLSPFFIAMFRYNIIRYERGGKYKFKTILGGAISIDVPVSLICIIVLTFLEFIK